jgi:hypothetical protein
VTPSSAAAPTGHPLLAPDLDPALPGLAAWIDPTSVADMFRLRWPDGDSSPVIRQCTLEHALWRPGVDCVCTYRLDVLGRDGEASTMGAVAVSPGGVRHWLYNNDPALPGLASAADPRAINAWLCAQLGGDIQEYTITPVRYRAGTRCVLRYQPRGGDALCLYGKVVAGNACLELAMVVSSLGDSLVAPYVGVVADWQLVVQRDAGHESLRAVPFDLSDSAATAFAAAGQLLARLHAHSAPHGPVRSLGDDIDELLRLEPALQLVDPACADRFSDGIARLQARIPSSEATVASHGAYRADQVHLSARGPVMIDLDSYCLAEPARDAANFLAYLRWRAIRGAAPAAAVAHVRDAFVDGYSNASKGTLNAERLRVFEAAALLKIAGRRCRSLSAHEWQHLPLLIDTAIDMLAVAPESAQ